MHNYTLITGASKGIGKAFAHECAQRKMNLILVSRSKVELETLAQALRAAHNIQVQVYAQDLCRPDAAKNLFNFCTRHHYWVDTLINNAGFGLWGEFENLSIEEQIATIQLNVVSLVAITHAFIPMLKKQKRSHVLNVSSIAGFMPMPYFSIYAASKSFVTSFSRALRQELKKENVKISCLCPGPTSSEFVNRAGMTDFKWNKEKLMMTAEDVANIAVKGMLKGKEVIIPGTSNKLSGFLGSALPKSLVSRFMGVMYRP